MMLKTMENLRNLQGAYKFDKMNSLNFPGFQTLQTDVEEGKTSLQLQEVTVLQRNFVQWDGCRLQNVDVASRALEVLPPVKKYMAEKSN